MLVVVAAVAVTALSCPACCYSDAVDVEFPLYSFTLSAFSSFS